MPSPQTPTPSSSTASFLSPCETPGSNYECRENSGLFTAERSGLERKKSETKGKGRRGARKIESLSFFSLLHLPTPARSRCTSADSGASSREDEAVNSLARQGTNEVLAVSMITRLSCYQPFSFPASAPHESLGPPREVGPRATSRGATAHLRARDQEYQQSSPQQWRAERAHAQNRWTELHDWLVRKTTACRRYPNPSRLAAESHRCWKSAGYSPGGSPPCWDHQAMWMLTFCPELVRCIPTAVLHQEKGYGNRRRASPGRADRYVFASRSLHRPTHSGTATAPPRSGVRAKIPLVHLSRALGPGPAPPWVVCSPSTRRGSMSAPQEFLGNRRRCIRRRTVGSDVGIEIFSAPWTGTAAGHWWSKMRRKTRLINFKFLLQPHQKYYITQHEELDFS